ncbi:MAG TPA: malate dehydrogenase (quinone) [Chloroflexota bacterium]|nr:malate dehydrogenase (quinone) [Chloroflexota bacterium]
MASKAGDVDAALVGGGIMSATLGVLLKYVEPDWDVVAYERLDEVGQESSFGLHNAGTGHAGLCELNYTPQREDGSIDIRKAVITNEQFQESLQFWASLVQRGQLPNPDAFIHSLPHMSYVRGADDVRFLQKRYDALAGRPLFEGLEYTEDRGRMAEWVPLMMDGRSADGPIAMTRIGSGTDVNFGAVASHLFALQRDLGVDLRLSTEVVDLEREPDGRWLVSARDWKTGKHTQQRARFVFIGAGGHVIHLLQKSDIPEAKGYGGFPVSGQFLRCTNRELVEMHNAKVYGKPQAKAPPMSMPHLDRRYHDRTAGLLFGPYAGFTPKFLKQGRYTDLARSVGLDNIPTLLRVARDEFDLTKYLIGQVIQKHESRVEVLRDFVPTADRDDWELVIAGQRVQTMKRTARKRGAIVFGTDLVVSDDGTLAGLMGASPGASTAVSIMIDVLRGSFPQQYAQWQPRLRELVPSVDISLSDDAALREDVRSFVESELELGQNVSVEAAPEPVG